MGVISRRVEPARVVSGQGRWVLALVLWLAVLAGCATGSRSGVPVHQAPESFARMVLALIDAGDIRGLAASVHPRDGVRFSPYATVSLDGDVRLAPAELISAWEEDRVLVWGHYDGTGEPIELSIRAYVDEFVVDADFSRAPKVGVNEVIGRGNSVNNLQPSYPGATFVEFHFPGFDSSFQGMDWKSLRLVLQPRGDRGWWLVGLVHDAWTI